MSASSNWADTIVALATPPGIGAIGVIRLSGGDAIAIVNSLFKSKDLRAQPGHTLHVGLLSENAKVIDEVVVSLFKGPKSYTGEDVVELSCHGSPYVQEQVLQACIRQGGRMAKPGEFTQRAFLNGRLDLTQAEAVADLIASNTAASQKNALHNIRGGFAAVLRQLREQLIQFSALIELELDFSQEDVEFADRQKFKDLIAEALQTTQRLTASFQLGNVIKQGVSVAIVGRPNAGKSTLLNALLNENRAIVSDIAGTTRDTIEEVLNIDGILFRLVDTAGIRHHSADIIENMGIEKSLEKIQQADIVLYLFDMTTTSPDVLKQDLARYITPGKKLILCGTRQDLFAPPDIDGWMAEIKALTTPYNYASFLGIAAPKGTNISTLKYCLVEDYKHHAAAQDTTIVTNARHYEALAKVQQSLMDIDNGLHQQIPGDLLALDIRRCLHYIGEITGDVSNEDVLDYVFSKFCIGK
jgi:tRNA modification GTPase